MKSLRDFITLVEAEQVELEAAAQQAAAQTSASGPTPQAAKALAKADQSQKQWVNGERYVYSDTEAGPQWVLDYSTVPGRQVGSTGLSGMFTKGTTQSRAANAYSGADSGAAAAGNVGAKIVNGKAVPPSTQAQQPAKKTATPDPKVLALQKELIAKGATNPDGTPLKADGIMGPNTKAAQAAIGGQAQQPAAGSLPPNTVVQGPNPGIDDATRAAAMKAVGANPLAPAQEPAAGTGQAGPTVAAAQGTDPNNPLKPATQPQASPEQVAQFMAQAKKTPGVGQPAAAPQAAQPAAQGQTGTPAQPYYGQDLSTMKVYKEDQELARIVDLARR